VLAAFEEGEKTGSVEKGVLRWEGKGVLGFLRQGKMQLVWGKESEWGAWFRAKLRGGGEKKGEAMALGYLT